MSLTLSNAAPATPQPTGNDLAELTKTVSKWGTEAGFLGIEGHLEGRVQALVREASVRIFGNCDAERDRLLCRIEAIEKDLDQSDRKVEEVRDMRESLLSRGGLLSWIRAWFAGRSEVKEARALHARNDPDLRQAHLDFEIAERARRDAAEWREMAVQSLRASYEYHKARASVVRPEKEHVHDTRDNRQFIVHRAN